MSEMENVSITFIGAGNMAEALIRGLLNAKTISARQITATDLRAERLAQLGDQYGIHTEEDNARAVASADIIVLAVKPQQMTDALKTLGAADRNTVQPLFISIAAGVTTVRIENALDGSPRVVRVMPNTPALVGEGASAIAGGQFATAADLNVAETILGAVGLVVRVEESLMDAVTALSGSGPAYIFYIAEAMVAAAQQVGLSEEVANQLAVQTIKGAGQLLANSHDSAAELRRKVTSPGGTTQAALTVMEERNLKTIFADAINAATKRGQELSST